MRFRTSARTFEGGLVNISQFITEHSGIAFTFCFDAEVDAINDTVCPVWVLVTDSVSLANARECIARESGNDNNARAVKSSFSFGAMGDWTSPSVSDGRLS